MTSFSSAPTVFFLFLASFPSPRSPLAVCPRPAVVADAEVLADAEDPVEVLVEVLEDVEDHAVGSVEVAVEEEEEASAVEVLVEVLVDVEAGEDSVEAVEVRNLLLFLLFFDLLAHFFFLLLYCDRSWTLKPEIMFNCASNPK